MLWVILECVAATRIYEILPWNKRNTLIKDSEQQSYFTYMGIYATFALNQEVSCGFLSSVV